MKKVNRLIALIIALLISITSIPVKADEMSVVKGSRSNVETIKENVISDSLLEKLREIPSMDEQTQIPVYVWYEDINYESVEKEVEKRTGITLGSIDTDLKMPSEDVLNKLAKMTEKTDRTYECVKEMQSYLDETQIDREYERSITDEYINTKRMISKEKIKNKYNKVFKNTSIDKTNVVFRSKYAPMIIAKLTKKEIEELIVLDEIVSIELCDEESVSNVMPWNSIPTFKDINGYDDVIFKTGLTGNGVTMGMIDHDTPYNYACEELDMDRIEILGSEVQYWSDDECPHSVNSSIIIMGSNGIAPNIEKMYVTTFIDPNLTPNYSYYECMEYLCDKGVKIINQSIGLNAVRNNNSYHNIEKWLDYITNQFGITVVQSEGNGYSSNYDESYRSVWVPGASYNVITVGAMNDNDTADKNDDKVFYYNSCGTSGGCAKPDILAPANLAGGGTSSAAPVVSGIIALMLELKPSLSLYPQAIKAVLMASCHRKVLDQFVDQQTETMEQGLTEQQGAGVVDPYMALCIVGSGQYGLRRVGSAGTEINIVQPKYNAQKMNVSIVWMQQNIVISEDEMFYPGTSISDSSAHNLSLNLYENETTLFASSNLQKSSTEMVYVPLNNVINKYRIKINGDSTKNSDVMCAYAWSTNKMYYHTPTILGIYRFKNYLNTLYLDMSSAGEIFQNSFNDSKTQEWIINKSINNSDKFIMINGSSDEYVSQGISTEINVPAEVKNTYSEIGIVDKGEYFWIYKENEDDELYLQPVSQIASIGMRTCWSGFSLNQSQMWLTEKVNYLCGDMNQNGVLEAIDGQMIQQYVVQLISFSETQKYLADVDGDGIITVSDAKKVFDRITGLE